MARTTTMFLRISAAALVLILGGVTLIGAPGKSKSAGKTRSAADLSEADVNFIRPGLVMKVAGAEIAQDGTIKAKIKLTDTRGLPLDREGVSTPGTVSVSFIAAYIPANAAQYVAYTTRTQTSPINSVSAVQASGESNGLFTKTGEGEYTYTFVAKAPAGFDAKATHAIGIYGSRSLTEFELGTNYDDDVYNFVPNGSKVAQVRDVIRTATCNGCHHDMGFHGGSRKTMEMCILCHQPQSVDPDTGNSVDMPVMIHKIHMGSSLPSVKAGTPYVIIGNRQSVNDYSKINFPADARNCLICHDQNSAAVQKENVFKPNRAACGACHDNVDFFSGTNHIDLPQFTDNQCKNCHVKWGEYEFDASILGAHTIPRFAPSLPGVVFEIVDVTGAAPGQKPTVTFKVTDKAGNPLDPSKMARLSIRAAGPTTDYKASISETALTAKGSNGVYQWTFVNALPADAKGSFAVSIEGRTEIKVLAGTKKELLVRDSGANKTIFFSVDGSKVAPRRTIVETAKCNACHGSLAAHGDARNQVENCAICHNPNLVAGSGAAAQPVDFAIMVHRIHRGEELTRPYKFGNTSFNEIGYPGLLNRCSACHVNGSEQLPLQAGLLSKREPNGPIDPVPAATGACMGCHDSIETAGHALTNISRLGESCSVCHGPNSDMAVSKVHQ